MKRRPPFEIRASPIHGVGAFATRRIRAGTRLIEYAGARITPAEADERYPDTSGVEHHTFLFAIDDEWVVDAAVDGNDARWINHSCDPNCESEIEKGRVYIFALRDIRVGEELAYDYAYERSGDETEKEEKLYACRCGAKHCRGSIMEPIEDFKKRQRALARKRAATRAKRKSARA